MAYNSYLVVGLQSTINQIAVLNPYRTTDAHDYYFALSNDNDRQDYIEKTEIFVHRIASITGFINDLLFFAKTLEEIRQTHDKFVLDRKKFVHMLPGLLSPIPVLSKSFCDNMHGFVRMLQGDLHIVSGADMKTTYDELEYIALLRNEFIHHPLGTAPTDNIWSSTIESDPKKIPFAQIGPGGGGWTYMGLYYQSQISDPTFAALSPDQQLEENRIALLAAGGWKNAARDNTLIFRIKAYGLPQVNQQKASTQLEDLFNTKIMPYLQTIAGQARIDHIIP